MKIKKKDSKVAIKFSDLKPGDLFIFPDSTQKHLNMKCLVPGRVDSYVLLEGLSLGDVFTSLSDARVVKYKMSNELEVEPE